MITIGIDPVSFLNIRWYGIMIALAILVIALWLLWQVRRGAKLSNDTIYGSSGRHSIGDSAIKVAPSPGNSISLRFAPGSNNSHNRFTYHYSFTGFTDTLGVGGGGK